MLRGCALGKSVYTKINIACTLSTLLQVCFLLAHHHLESVTPGSRDSPQTPIPVTASRSDTDLVLGWLLMLDPGLAKAWNELADWS